MGKLLSEATSLGDNEIPLSSFQYFTATLGMVGSCAVEMAFFFMAVLEGVISLVNRVAADSSACSHTKLHFSSLTMQYAYVFINNLDLKMKVICNNAMLVGLLVFV